MTITNTTLASPTYNGNGATTAFATGFQFISNSDLQVVVTDASGVETIKTITTHYTVTGAGVSGGGTVTFLVAPATGTFVNIKSNVTLDQQVDYVEGGAFSAATHETALDKLTKAVQQVKEITDRSLKLPISNQSITTQTSPITAGYILGVNDAGTALEWKTPADVASGATISTFGASLVDDADASEARTTLGLGSMSTQSSSSVSITGGTVSGITDIALADGGTGASLTDPNADRIMFWDDSAGQVTWLTAGTGLTITDTTIDVSGASGTPGGSNTHVQFNNSSAFGGDSGFVYSGSGGAQLTSNLIIGGNATASGYLELREDTDNGSNYIRIQAPSAVTANTTLLLPDGAGSSGQVLTTNGSGTLSWGSASGSWTKISSSTASASATIDFTGLSSTYKAYMVVLDHVAPATDDVALLVRTSTNNGSSYDSGASDYIYYVDGVQSNAAANGTSSAGATSIALTSSGAGSGIGNSTSESISGYVHIIGHSTAAYGQLVWQTVFSNTVPRLVYNNGAGQRVTAADIDAIRFLMSSGNIASGVFTLYGLTA